jgi:hypothetical protein
MSVIDRFNVTVSGREDGQPMVFALVSAVTSTCGVTSPPASRMSFG